MSPLSANSRRRLVYDPMAEGNGKVAVFHLSALYSPIETWTSIAVDRLAAKADPARLQAWTNLKLGEPYEDRETAALAPDVLMARAEEADWSETLPPGVAVLVAGADVQADRIEVEIIGWGRGEESWSISYQIIAGDTSQPSVWSALDRVLTQRFKHAKDVADLPISAVAIDSGFRTDQVCQFCAPRTNRRVWAVAGRAGAGIRTWPARPPKAKRRIVPVHIVGVDTLKSTLMARLRATDKPGPICHFPIDREQFWFSGLVSERAIRRYHRGIPRIEWVKDPGTRNEPIDARVYGIAALYGLYAGGFRLEETAARVAAAPDRTPDQPNQGKRRESYGQKLAALNDP